MKKVLFRSVYDAFDYVMDHFYPPGLEEMAERRDSYAVISIQDTHTGGFGLEFKKNLYCRDVLTLYFDDIVRETEGAVMFTEEMAGEIISFIEKNMEAETLLVHCHGGASRSRAVAAFAVKLLGGDNGPYFSTGLPNQAVYDILEAEWIRRKLTEEGAASGE